MPSTVYKGDLAEVTFGHETGLVLDYAKPTGLIFTASNAAADGTTTITFSGNPSMATTLTSNSSVELKYPNNMLVGARVRFIGNGTSSYYALDDYANHGHVYTIVANTATTIKVTPELKGNTSGAVGASVANDSMIIDSFGVPTINTDETNMNWNTEAASSSELVLTDQFLGLAGTVTLPETKADIKRYHVVGLGRDVAVQAPGKFTYEGGSFEIAMHSARWLYYALGGTVAIPTQKVAAAIASNRTNSGALSAGQTYIDLNDTVAGAKMVDDSASGEPVAVGDYVWIKEVSTSGADLIPLVTHTPIDLTVADSGNDYFGGSNADVYAEMHDDSGTRFDATLKHEMRRITGFDVNRIYLDDPLSFSHKTGLELYFYDYGDEAEGAPAFISDGVSFTDSTCDYNDDPTIDHDDDDGRIQAGMEVSGTGIPTGATVSSVTSDTRFELSAATTTGPVTDGTLTFTGTAAHHGTLRHPVHHVIFTHSNLPSFCVETSVRKRDVGSYSNEDGGGAPDSATDSGQLTRVFRGCKVGSFTISADTDAALKMTVGFNAAHCYTDTGRLEASTPGDRYTAHRMFENTANTDTARLESGIGKHTQKPFFFYNGSVSVAGKALAQVTTFSLTGSTGVTHVHTIGASPLATNINATSGLSLDQVPFGGSRNPSMAIEGKATYDMTMEIITDDPTFFHHMRTTDEFSNRTGDRATNDGIKLSFTKQGVGASPRERMTILIDEYYIAEAPLPIPEDKGMIRSALKIVPQSIKVVATDTMFHY